MLRIQRVQEERATKRRSGSTITSWAGKRWREKRSASRSPPASPPARGFPGDEGVRDEDRKEKSRPASSASAGNRQSDRPFHSEPWGDPGPMNAHLHRRHPVPRMVLHV